MKTDYNYYTKDKSIRLCEYQIIFIQYNYLIVTIHKLRDCVLPAILHSPGFSIPFYHFQFIRPMYNKHRKRILKFNQLHKYLSVCFLFQNNFYLFYLCAFFFLFWASLYFPVLFPPFSNFSFHFYFIIILCVFFFS